MKVEFTLTDVDLDALAERIASRLLAAQSSNSTSANRGDAGKLLFTEQEAAASLGVSRYTLKRWREQGHVKAHVSRRPVRYRREDIDAISQWMRTRAREE